MVKKDETKYIRLSDQIVIALQTAVAQEDVGVADALMRALELSMTRKAGGEGFKERREFSSAISDVMDKAGKLRKR